ncbi:hypothetical protein [Streptomyces sp. NPDC053720]|uniref:hypothetical protein n=1 Tax=Streptomyces sp. NPDC053720 TaxID=3154855 RepID=UPI003426B3EC
MTEIAYPAQYVTQDQLGRAYHRLGHTSPTNRWSATLLIDEDLRMYWACPVVAAPATDEDPARYDWQVIADAGELDWPPLRDEEEIWPALLAKHPVPTGHQAEAQARLTGKTVEEWHRESLRRTYLCDAHIGTTKRNPTDINFSPLVRDWDATARELAAFLDTHPAPKLTTTQRIKAQGVHRARLLDELSSTNMSLARLMRNVVKNPSNLEEKPRKLDLARWAGVTRPTVDSWLNDSTDGEPDVRE